MQCIQKLFEGLFLIRKQKYFGEDVNIYLIEEDKRITLFDTPNYSDVLAEELKSFNKEIICILSHGPSGTSDGEIWKKKLGVKFYLNKDDINNRWLNMTPDILFNNLSISKDYEVINTPGHTSGSVCIYHSVSKSLLTGDSLLVNNEIPEIYINTQILETLLKYDFKNLLPLHYSYILDNGKTIIKSKTIKIV